jgi:hypothetical protein
MAEKKPAWKYRGAIIQLLGLTVLLLGGVQLVTEVVEWFTADFTVHLGRLFWGLLMTSAGAELFALRESGRKKVLFVMALFLLILVFYTALDLYFNAFEVVVRIFGYEYHARNMVESLFIIASVAFVPVILILFLSSRKSRALMKDETSSEIK